MAMELSHQLRRLWIGLFGFGRHQQICSFSFECFLDCFGLRLLATRVSPIAMTDLLFHQTTNLLGCLNKRHDVFLNDLVKGFDELG
jgi:hypothetical protein